MLILLLAALLELVFVLYIFQLKKMLYAILALVLVFIANAAIFALVGMVFVAILQLFVIVGGIATYLLVGLSPSMPMAVSISKPKFALSAIVLMLAFSFAISKMGFASSKATSINIYAIFGNISFLYLLVLALFAICIAAIVVIKKIGVKK
ncbi:MAG: hypothetical protein ACP5RP_00135 [Candidatus Micrarchaeia archaeon]